MGIEKNWVKQTKKDPLEIHPEEWTAIQQYVDSLIKNGPKQPPFKLSRKELIINTPMLGKHRLRHSVLVIPLDPTDHDYNKAGKPQYKIGFLARSKTYFNYFGEKKEEGILGHGAFGMVKVIKWQNGSIDAVKIEGTKTAKATNEQKTETQIMKQLGYLKAAFIENLSGAKSWIDNKIIQNKLYTVQKKHEGIDMDKYFCSLDFRQLNDNGKYEIGLKAALSIQQLHDQGILHCDIKPANFLINCNKDIAITAVDFGFAMKFHAGTTPGFKPGDPIPKSVGVIKGSPFYMSPETKQGKYSQESDVYALGMMFKEDLKIGATGSSPAYSLVQRMISPDPYKRPQMKEVVQILQSLKSVPIYKVQNMVRPIYNLYDFQQHNFNQDIMKPRVIYNPLKQNWQPKKEQYPELKQFLHKTPEKNIQQQQQPKNSINKIINKIKQDIDNNKKEQYPELKQFLHKTPEKNIQQQQQPKNSINKIINKIKQDIDNNKKQQFNPKKRYKIEI